MKKFLIYTFTYLLVTIAAAFGTMTVSSFLGGNTTVVITSPTEEVEKELSDGEKLMNKLLSISNTNVNLEFDIYDNTTAYSVDQTTEAEPTMTVKFDGSLSIEDLENIKIAGTLSATVNGQDVIIDIVLVDNVLYLSNETMTIKLKNASIAKLIELLPTLGLKVDLGIDFSTIDTNQLLAKLQELKATKIDDNNLKMTFNLTEDICFDIFTDSEYSIKSIATNKMQLAGKTATINANLDDENVDDISNPDTNNTYVDVTNTINIVDNIKEILSNKRLHLNLDAELVGATNITLLGDVDIDYNDAANLYAEFDANLGGTIHKVSIGYIDGNAYVGFNNAKFVVDQANLEGTIEAISKHFDIEEAQANMLVTIAKIIPGFELSKVLEGDLGNININNLLAFAKGEDNVINITVYGNAIGIENDLNLVISLDDNDQFESISISNISLLDSKFSANITYSPEVNIPDLKSDGYVNMLDVPNLVSAILSTVDDIKADNFCSVTIDTNIVIDGVGIDIAGVASIDFRQSDNIVVFADLVASINNHDIDVKVGLEGEDIYIIIADQLRFTCKTSDVKSLINSGINMINDSDMIAIINAVLSLTQEPSVLIDLLKGNIDKLPTNLLMMVESNMGKFDIRLNKEYLNLDQDLVISLLYNTKILGVTIEDIKIDNCNVDLRLGLNGNLYRYDFGAFKYISLSNASTLLDSIVATIQDYNETNKLAVTLSSNLQIMGMNLAVSGDIAAKDGVVYINMDVRTDNFGVRVVAHIVDNILYLDIDGLKLSIGLDKIGELASIIEMSDDVKSVITNILPNIDFDELRDFDFSGIDFGALKSLEILDDKTTIILDKSLLNSTTDITIALGYNQTIRSLEISGLDTESIIMDLTANTIDIDIPSVSGEYSNLDNISDLANAITNWVNQLKSEREFAANINATITYSGQIYNLSGTIYVDYSHITDTMDITKLDVYASVVFGEYSAKIWLYNGYIYIDAFGQKLKLAVSSIEGIIDVIATNLNIDIDIEPLLDNISNSVVGKIMQGDYSTIRPTLLRHIELSDGQLLLGIDRSVLSTNNDFYVTINYDDSINSIGVESLRLQDCGVNANLTILDHFDVPTLVGIEYSDISDIDNAANAIIKTINRLSESKEIALQINNVNIEIDGIEYVVTGLAYVDYSNAIIDTENGKALDINNLDINLQLQYVTGSGYAHNLTLVLLDGRVYVDYNNIKLSIDIDDISELADIANQIVYVIKNIQKDDTYNVAQLLELSRNQNVIADIDIIGMVANIIKGVDIESILAGDYSSLSIDIIKYISIIDNAIHITLQGVFGEGVETNINIDYTDMLDGITFEGIETGNIKLGGAVEILRDYTAIEIGDTNEYLDLDNLDKLLNAIISNAASIMDNSRISLDINASIILDGNNIDIIGAVVLTQETIYANVDILALGREISAEIYLQDNVIYADIDGLKVSMSTSKISELLDTLGMSIGVDITSMLPNIDIEKLKNLDFSEINFGWIDISEIGLNTTTLSIAADLLGLDSDIDVVIDYSDGLKLDINNLTISNASIDASAELTNNSIPEMTKIYSRLDNITDMYTAINNTINHLRNAKHIAVNLDNTVAINGNSYDIAGLVYVDYSNLSETIQITDLDIYARMTISQLLEGEITIRLCDSTLYVDYKHLHISIAVQSITDLMNNLSDILPSVDIDKDTINNLISGSILADILDGNYDRITTDLIRDITLTDTKLDITLASDLLATAADLSISMGYSDKINTLTIGEAVLDQYKLSGNIMLDYAFVPAEVVEDNYSSISGISNAVSAIRETFNQIADAKEIALQINNVNIEIDGIEYVVTGLAYVDYSNAIIDTENGKALDINNLDINLQLQYVTGSGYAHNLTLVLLDGRVYVDYNNIKLSIDIDDISELADIANQIVYVIKNIQKDDTYNVAQLLELSRNQNVIADIDIIGMVANIIKGVDIESILAGDYSSLSIDIIKYISIIDNAIHITLQGVFGEGVETNINIDYTDMLDGITFEGIETGNIKLGGAVEILRDYTAIEIGDTNEYLDLDNLDKLLNAIISNAASIMDNSRISLDINASIILDGNNIDIIGAVVLTQETIYANVDILALGREISAEIYLQDNVIYADIDGLKVSMSTSKISELLDTLGMSIGVDITSMLPNIDIEKLKNLDFSEINFGWIDISEIGLNTTTLSIAADLLGLDSDIDVVIDYSDGLKLDINNLTISNASIDASAELTNNSIPEMTKIYSRLDNITDMYTAINNTINHLRNAKHIAVNLDNTVAINGNSYDIAGLVYVDYSNLSETIQITDLDIYARMTISQLLEGEITIRLCDSTLYVDYKHLHISIAVQSITDLMNNLSDILPSVDIDKDTINNLISGSILADILDGNYDRITTDLIRDITLTDTKLDITLASDLLATAADLSISMGYSDKINTLTIGEAVLDQYKLSGNIMLDYAFVPAEVVEDNYSSISGISNAVSAIRETFNQIADAKEIAFAINNLNVELDSKSFVINGMAHINWANAIVDSENGKTIDVAGLNGAIRIAAVEENGYIHNITIIYTGDRLYLTYNHLAMSVSTDKIKTVVDLVKVFKFVSDSLKTEDITNVSMRELVDEARASASGDNGKLDIVDTIKNLLPNIDIDAIMAGDIGALDISIIQNISIDDSNINIVINGQNISSSTDMMVNFNYSNVINTISLSGLNRTDISASGNVELLQQFVAITPDGDYIDLDNIDTPINSALNTAIDVIDNKHIAFGLNTSIRHSSLTKNSSGIVIKESETLIDLLDGSNARFDWSNAYTMEGEVNKFDVKSMKMYFGLNVKTITNTYNYSNGIKDTNPTNSVERMHYIEITYINNTIYIKYNNMYAKINGDSIDQIVNILCEICGIDASADTIGNLIGMIGQSTDKSMLDKLSIDMLQSISLSDNRFSLRLDLTNLGLGVDAINNLVLDVDYDNSGLTMVIIHDLAVANITINDVYVDLDNWSDICDPASADYIDLSGVGDLLETIKNTMEYRDFYFKGSVNLKIEMPIINTIDWNIPLELRIKILEDNRFEAQAVLSNIPAITAVNDDVPFKAGKSVEGINVGKNRTLTISIRDNKVYIYRIEDVPWGLGLIVTGYKKYEKKLMVDMETFLDDPLYYTLQYGMGFSQSIMDEIYKSVNKERVNPIDYSNVLKGFTSDGNYHQLTLNLRELLENDKVDTMSLGVRDTNVSGKDIVGSITFDMFMPLTDSVKITLASNNLTHQSIGSTIDFSALYSYVNNYAYNEGAEWDAYEGDWNLSSQREFTLNYETNCSTTIPSVTGIAGSELTLPTLATYVTEEGDVRTTHIFEGWYTTIDYQSGTEYTENVMPRRDTTLYAKWQEIVEEYIYISFVTNGGNEIADIRTLQNTAVDLPIYEDLLVEEVGDETITKQFVGWSVYEDCSVLSTNPFASDANITLYAKWDIISRTKPYQLTIMDGTEVVISKKVLPNTAIDYTSDKINDNTLFYLDSEFVNQVSKQAYETMPSNDVTLYIRNLYTVTITSAYGTVTSKTSIIYQSEAITLPSQNSYVKDDGNTRTTYTFLGYYVGDTKCDSLTYTMPNSNVDIVAKWDVDVKHYYTISFNMGYNYIAYKCALGSSYKTSPTQFASIKRLEGDVDLSAYQTSCVIWATAVHNGLGVRYTYDLSGWSKSVPDDYSNGGGSFTINITGDTTVYPCWKKR